MGFDMLNMFAGLAGLGNLISKCTDCQEPTMWYIPSGDNGKEYICPKCLIKRVEKLIQDKSEDPDDFTTWIKVGDQVSLPLNSISINTLLYFHHTDGSDPDHPHFTFVCMDLTNHDYKIEWYIADNGWVGLMQNFEEFVMQSLNVFGGSNTVEGEVIEHEAKALVSGEGDPESGDQSSEDPRSDGQTPLGWPDQHEDVGELYPVPEEVRETADDQ